MEASRERLPSLDGWRAISILVVLAGHLGGNLPEGSKLGAFLHANSYSAQGVNIFFVISGFLITTLLLDEKQASRSISLRRFYVRRAFRIFPVFYLYVLTILLLNFVLDWNISPVLFVKTSLYLNNFSFLGLTWVLIHSWSLSVEEQYYLMWPLVVKWTSTGRQLIAICIAFCSVGAVVRVAVYYWARRGTSSVPPLVQDLLRGFVTLADPIFVGSAFAILNKRYDFKTVFSNAGVRAISIFSSVLAFATIEVLRQHYRGGAITVPLGETIQSVACAMCLLYTIHRKSLLSALLNLRVLRLIGLWSYSLYIWQELFLFSRIPFPFLTPPAMPQYWFTAFPLNLLLLFAVAVSSYYFWERPFLRLRRRFFADHPAS